MVYLLIGFAGAAGAILRYLIGITFLADSSFPYTTLLINLVGCFLLTWFIGGFFQKNSLPEPIRIAITSGFLGSFTTFSALSVETIQLFQKGNPGVAVLYVCMSIFGGLYMSSLGYKMNGKEGQAS